MKEKTKKPAPKKVATKPKMDEPETPYEVLMMARLTRLAAAVSNALEDLRDRVATLEKSIAPPKSKKVK